MPGKYIESKQARWMSRQKSFTSSCDALLALVQTTMWNLEVLNISCLSRFSISSATISDHEKSSSQRSVSLDGEKDGDTVLHPRVYIRLHQVSVSLFTYNPLCMTFVASQPGTSIFFYVCSQPEIIISNSFFLPKD